MSVLEVVAGFQWLYTTLSGDSTLTGYAPGGVFRSLAPPSVATPFVVFAHQAGSDKLTMNAFRIFVELLFQVKAVGPASNTAGIGNAAARIDTLIKLASGNVTGGAILACWRESPLFLDEEINGEVWSNIGGFYRMQVEQSS